MYIPSFPHSSGFISQKKEEDKRCAYVSEGDNEYARSVLLKEKKKKKEKRKGEERKGLGSSFE